MSLLRWRSRATQPPSARRPALTSEDYPALFRAADSYSVAQQRVFFALLGLQLFLLTAATVVSVASSMVPHAPVAQALALTCALACAVLLFATKPDRCWYASRAVAESVKTVTWRYVTRAEPFDAEDDEARQAFQRMLGAVVEQNREVAQRFRSYLAETQLSAAMRNLWESDLQDRLQAFVHGRVVEQQEWYAQRCTSNSRRATLSFVMVVIVLVLATVAALGGGRWVGPGSWPADALVVFATTMLAWSQAKRYSELAAAYSLAAVEIGILRLGAEDVSNEASLSAFVRDAENAFSREHTQWVARRHLS